MGNPLHLFKMLGLLKQLDLHSILLDCHVSHNLPLTPELKLRHHLICKSS